VQINVDFSCLAKRQIQAQYLLALSFSHVFLRLAFIGWKGRITVVSPQVRFAPSRFAPTQSRFAPSQSRFAPTQSHFAPTQSRFVPTQSRFAPTQSRFAPT